MPLSARGSACAGRAGIRGSADCIQHLALTLGFEGGGPLVKSLAAGFTSFLHAFIAATLAVASLAFVLLGFDPGANVGVLRESSSPSARSPRSSPRPRRNPLDRRERLRSLKAIGLFTLTVLVDNEKGPGPAQAEHGLPIWIVTGGLRVLFDSVQGLAARDNARLLGIDLAGDD